MDNQVDMDMDIKTLIIYTCASFSIFAQHRLDFDFLLVATPAVISTLALTLRTLYTLVRHYYTFVHFALFISFLI